MGFLYIQGLVAALIPIAVFAANGDRSITIDGRTLSCGNVPIYKSTHLPNMGAYDPFLRRIIINPRAQSDLSTEVKWFIFYHECGHAMGHLDEMRADAYAVARASEEGWLDQTVLNQICHSWGPIDAPASRTHPAPRDRCNAVLAVADRHRTPRNPPVGTLVTEGPRPAPNRFPATVAPPQPRVSGDSEFITDLFATR